MYCSEIQFYNEFLLVVNLFSKWLNNDEVTGYIQIMKIYFNITI